MKTDLVSNLVPSGIPDRRRHARYRFSMPITVYLTGRAPMHGMSLEISESGMSVMISDELIIGAAVELEPVAGGKVSAHVRRHTGKVYGFEFLELDPARVQRIVETCKMLPLYSSKTLDI